MGLGGPEHDGSAERRTAAERPMTAGEFLNAVYEEWRAELEPVFPGTLPAMPEGALDSDGSRDEAKVGSRRGQQGSRDDGTAAVIELGWLRDIVDPSVLLNPAQQDFIHKWIDDLAQQEDIGLGGRARIAEIASFIHCLRGSKGA